MLTLTDPPSVYYSREKFRLALSKFATGVAVITAQSPDNDSLVGVTANSFNSVSLEPQLILWCLALRSASLRAFRASTHYAVNVLAADQLDLAHRFASKGVDRFDGTPWRPGHTGAPVIEGALAVFECAQKNQHEEGDHVLFVGEVKYFHSQDDASPLLFHEGRFRTDFSH